MEEEPREAAEWWQFVTSTKMLHSKRLQRLWREQQFLKRVVGSAEYLDMQAGVRLEGESEGMESGLTCWRTSAHRFFSKLRQRLGERRSFSHVEEEDDGECVEYIEAPEFHVVTVEYDYGEVNAEGAGEEISFADMVEGLPVPDVVDYVEYIEASECDDGVCVEYIDPPDFHVVTVEYDYGEVNAEGAGEENPWVGMDEDVPVPDVVDDRSYKVALREARGRVLRKWCDGWGECLA